MNILPLLLFAVLLGGEKLYFIKDFLAKIDFKSFEPVLKMLGINNGAIDFLCSEKFNEMLSSDIDIKSLLPLLSTIFSKKDNEKEQNPTENTEKSCRNDYLSAIKNVAPTDVEETLNDFLSWLKILQSV